MTFSSSGGGSATSLWRATAADSAQWAFAFFPNDASGTFIVDAIVRAFLHPDSPHFCPSLVLTV